MVKPDGVQRGLVIHSLPLFLPLFLEFSIMPIHRRNIFEKEGMRRKGLRTGLWVGRVAFP